MEFSNHIGVILANTGTPKAPRKRNVRAYLARFLMDKRIAPMNRFVWWCILHLFILPKRAAASAEKYETIWTSQGSPYVRDMRKLARGVEEKLRESGYNVSVTYVLNYADPTMHAAFKQLRKQGCRHILCLPLYPQSAYSTTESIRDAFEKEVGRFRMKRWCYFVDEYSRFDPYAATVAASIVHAGFRAESDDRVLFSYHSVPLSDLDRGDTYEIETDASSLAVAGHLGIDRKRWTIGYQSVFGKKPEEWLAPQTSDVLARWGSQEGRAFIVCPGFAVDCLETLYEIPYDLRPSFEAARSAQGIQDAGEGLVIVPCLGATKAHAKLLSAIIEMNIQKGGGAWASRV